jgi:cytochrome P450
MQILKPIVGDGLLTSDGDFWRKQRRLAQPAFHPTQIANFARTFVESTQVRFDNWTAAARDGQTVAMDEEL